MPTTRPPLLSAFMGIRTGVARRCSGPLAITAAVLALTALGACSVDSAYPRDQNWGSPIGHVDAAADDDGAPDAGASDDVAPQDEAGVATDSASAIDATEGDADVSGADAASDASDAPASGAGDASDSAASDQALASLGAGT